MRKIHAIVSLLLFAMYVIAPATSEAFTYTQHNIHTVYHEAPAHFSVTEDGTMVGATVSGIPIRQRNVSNAHNVRLQRFEIGTAYWYISDRGIIWADNDLVALSVYLSRA